WFGFVWLGFACFESAGGVDGEAWSFLESWPVERWASSPVESEACAAFGTPDGNTSAGARFCGSAFQLKSIRRRVAGRAQLLRRCIVSRLRINPERWQPLWRK